MVAALGQQQGQGGEVGEVDLGTVGERVPGGQGDHQLVLPEREVAQVRGLVLGLVRVPVLGLVLVRDGATDERGVEPPVREAGQSLPDGERVELDAHGRGLSAVGVQDVVQPLSEAGDGAEPQHGWRGQVGGEGAGRALGRQHVPGRRQETLARRGQPHVARRAVEQLDPQLALQPPHLLAHGGLAEQQPLGGAPEVQLLRDGDEAVQLP